MAGAGAMKVLIFGATGMVGQAVLRECLLDRGVQLVQTVGRTATGLQDPKLREVVHPDLFHYEAIEKDLQGFDACFFCLGVSSGGMAEAQYRHLTYDLTIAAAECLSRLNPGMTFLYVSGAGTDSTETGRVMWARVKGKTENAILRLPFRAAYMIRPGMIQPVHGEQSKTAAYRILYKLAGPLLPLARRMLPRYIVTTEEIARVMLQVARGGAPKRVLESWDMRELLGSRT
jgi:uncharacterized protein YbjT (DUF2867 family)